MSIESRNNIFPASKIEEQYWLSNQFYPDNSSYNIPSFFRITGDFNIERAKKAIAIIAQRHSILRTTFKNIENQSMQVIHQDNSIDITIEDLREYDLGDEDLNEILKEEASLPFNLENGPLFRTIIFQLEDKEFILAITFHHIVIDLHSKGIFSKEFSEIYNNPASINNENSKKLEAPLQYSDYALWEKDFIQSEDYQKKITFWKNKISDKNYFLKLPADFERTAAILPEGNYVEIVLNEDVTSKIKRFSMEKNLSLFISLLTCYISSLYQITGQNDIILGIPMTNRGIENGEKIFGCLMNIIPLCLYEAECDFPILLQKVRKEMLLAHRNQQVPLKEIINHVKPKRIAGVSPLYQSGFTFEPPMELKLDNASIKPVVIHNSGSQLDTFVTLWEMNNRIIGRMEYNKNLFTKEKIESFVGIFLETINKNI